MSAYSKDLCIVQFTEASTLPATIKKVVNAFREGFYCFSFRLKYKGRLFQEDVALPKDADEKLAAEMAQDYFGMFCTTVMNLAAKRN